MDKIRGYQRMEAPPPMFDYPVGPSLNPDLTGGGGVAFAIPAENHRSSKFHHVADLDKFFTHVYRYHQRSGFFCMLLQESLELVQLAYIVIFSTFLLECVDYDVLFANKIPPSWRPWIAPVFNDTIPYGTKVTISDAVISTSQCLHGFSLGIVLLIVLAALFWMFRFVKVVSHVFTYGETRRFYRNALKIEDGQLVNLTWHEVLQRLLLAQKIHHMCIHKSELTELDVYHRILRVENYLIAMVNKNTLPYRFRVPFIGEVTVFTKSYLYNLEFILFRGWGSPFEHNWQLREDLKVYGRRAEVAEQLRKRIEYTALVNFLFCPVILVWRVLYAFFDYADLLKRDPGSLGARRWSYYGRYFLRHFNEVDHELEARLKRAYRPATQYMNIFSSPALVILAKNAAFIAGSLLAVLLLFAILDEDVLKVAHMLTIITLLGIIVALCRACIPDENAIFSPENLLSDVLCEIHYAPETWKTRAHTSDVRKEFSQLFQYRFVHICEELLSPITTPLILFFVLRSRCLSIVDFFRNFTVDLVGVGDVCSFAEMNVRKHGDPEWEPDSLINDDAIVGLEENKADYGKTELSLVHFKLTNPEWKPPMESTWFIQKLREEVEKGAQELRSPNSRLEDNAVLASLNALGPRVQGIMAASVLRGQEFARGNLISREGGLTGSGSAGLLNSVMSGSGNNEHSGGAAGIMGVNHQPSPIELTTADMSFSALFLHELHRKRMKSTFREYKTIGEEEVSEEASTQLAGSSSGRNSLRDFREQEEGTPLLLLRK